MLTKSAAEEETLSVILGRLGLTDWEETFQKEQIDTEALVGTHGHMSQSEWGTL